MVTDRSSFGSAEGFHEDDVVEPAIGDDQLALIGRAVDDPSGLSDQDKSLLGDLAHAVHDEVSALRAEMEESGLYTDSELAGIRLVERDIDSLATQYEAGMIDPDESVSAWRRALLVLSNDADQYSDGRLDRPLLIWRGAAVSSG